MGLGIRGSKHAGFIDELPFTELAAVCDINRERAEQLARKYGTTPYSNHLEMLEKAGLDAVLIATPHYDHPDISIDSFDRGIHVLVEFAHIAIVKIHIAVESAGIILVYIIETGLMFCLDRDLGIH